MFPQKVGWKAQKAKAVTPRPKPRSIASRAPGRKSWVSTVSVVGIAPGILEKTGLRTPEYEEALAWTRNITVEQLREGYTKNAIPIGRAGRLAEVADFVCYLLSERASYITGVTTNIAGGKTRG